MTPVLTALPGGLLVAVALSLGAGLWAGDTLDLARVFGLLPFYVMGLKATPARLELLRGTPQRVVAVLVLAGIGVLAAHLDRWASTEWLYYRAMYAELEVSDPRALVTRAALLLIGTAGTWAFLALVPRRDGWFTRMGSYTLVVYLFHGFVVKAADYAGYDGWADAHPAVSLALTSVLALALALLLAHPRVGERLTVLVDPLGYGERRAATAVDLTLAGAGLGVLEPPRDPDPRGGPEQTGPVAGVGERPGPG